MYKRHIIGKFGEAQVEKYLLKKNYTILNKNFRCNRGEIDIIALDKKQIVFIEVKSRTNTKYGLPSESVTKQKLKHIYKTAEYYLYLNKLEKENTRIDVIELYIENEKFIINHIKQVM